MANSRDRFVYDFDIYCDRNSGNGEIEPTRWEEAKLAHFVVTKLIECNDEKSHVVVMDNRFTNIDLFEELAQKGTYAIGLLELAGWKFFKNIVIL